MTEGVFLSLTYRDVLQMSTDVAKKIIVNK